MQKSLSIDDSPNWFLLFVQAVLIGAFTGVLVGLFRYMNDHITAYFVHAYQKPAFGSTWLWIVVFVLLFVFAVVSILLLRWERLIGGSGIPQVEIMMRGDLKMNWWRVLISKFLGALTSLAGGLSLGREGPCIMMGASLGVGVGRLWYSKEQAHARRLLAAGGSAGLAAAFGAPIAGFCFIFEEAKLPLLRSLVLSCVISCFTAVWVMQAIFGFPLVFPFSVHQLLPWQYWWSILFIGILMGLLGVFYNRILIGLTYWVDRTKMLPLHLRVFIPFFISGLLLYFYPTVLVGYGVSSIQLEHLALPFSALIILLFIKLLFSATSYASGVAGGLLMPILLMGAVAGANIVSALTAYQLLDAQYSGVLLAMAMAGLFGASIRAPLTGAFLMIEMTGSYTNAILIIITAYIASFVANKLHNQPVYDTLRERAEASLLPTKAN